MGLVLSLAAPQWRFTLTPLVFFFGDVPHPSLTVAVCDSPSLCVSVCGRIGGCVFVPPFLYQILCQRLCTLDVYLLFVCGLGSHCLMG